MGVSFLRPLASGLWLHEYWACSCGSCLVWAVHFNLSIMMV